MTYRPTFENREDAPTAAKLTNKITGARADLIILDDIAQAAVERPLLTGVELRNRIEAVEAAAGVTSKTPYPDGNPKTAVGATKPSFHAIPTVALIPMGQAMADGCRKYGLTNWRDRPVTTSVYYNAILRHMFSFMDGEDVAEDSGVHHLGHVMACCAILLDARSLDKLNDDRPNVPGRFAAVVAEVSTTGKTSLAPC